MEYKQTRFSVSLTLGFVMAKLSLMNLKQWLDKERGRYAALAAHLGISASRMSQIAEDGVPDKYKLAVRDFTKRAVSLESLVQARTPKPTPQSQTA